MIQKFHFEQFFETHFFYLIKNKSFKLRFFLTANFAAEQFFAIRIFLFENFDDKNKIRLKNNCDTRNFFQKVNKKSDVIKTKCFAIFLNKY